MTESEERDDLPGLAIQSGTQLGRRLRARRRARRLPDRCAVNARCVPDAPVVRDALQKHASSSRCLRSSILGEEHVTRQGRGACVFLWITYFNETCCRSMILETSESIRSESSRKKNGSPSRRRVNWSIRPRCDQLSDAGARQVLLRQCAEPDVEFRPLRCRPTPAGRPHRRPR